MFQQLLRGGERKVPEFPLHVVWFLEVHGLVFWVPCVIVQEDDPRVMFA